MAERPIPVAVCAVVSGSRILLIKRTKGNFIGYWALPGGKIEPDEHLSDAAVREIREETGIDSEFISYIGLVSEHLISDSRVTDHFILHLCKVRPVTTKITRNEAGKARWFELEKLDELKGGIVPSDLEMIDRILLKNEGTYFESVMEWQGKSLVLKKFEHKTGLQIR